MHSRSFLKLVRIAISPRQAKISCRKSKGIANRRPTFEAFIAVASSLQATKKSRKKGQEIATLHRATAAEYNSKAGWAKAGGQPSVAFAIGSALQLTATKRGVVFMVFSFWPSVKQKKVAKEGSKAATSATTTPCRRRHRRGHSRRRRRRL